MKTFISLFKISLNLNFGLSALKYRFTKEKKRLWEPILIGVSAGIGIIMLLSMIIFFTMMIYMGGKQANHPEMVLTLAMVACQIVILIFGIFYLMGAFYFSRDLNIFIPLPLKPSQVLGSKFAVVMVNEYLTAIPFLLPAIVIYGIGTGQGILYWIKGLLILLSAPAIPLAIGAVFVLILMRFVNVRKNKDLLAVLGGFLGLLIVLGVNFFSQRMANVQESEFFNQMADAQNGIIQWIGSKFPPSIWATFGLSGTGWYGLSKFLLFIGLSAAFFCLMMLLGSKVFYRGILAGQEISRKKRVLSRQELNQQAQKETHPVVALFWKEWKLFLRTPLFVMNGIMGMVMAPILVVMPFIANSRSNAQVLPYIHNPKYAVPVALAGLAVMLFGANMNIIANTSLSREGQMFWISKMIPVSPKEQVLAKVLHGLVVELFGILVAAVVLVLLLKIAVYRIMIMAVLALLASFILILLNLMVDVLRPKLEWTNPQEAVKRNINVFFGMLLTFLVMGIMGGIAVVLFLIFHVPELVAYFILAIILVALAVPAAIGLFALAEARYKRIEV